MLRLSDLGGDKQVDSSGSSVVIEAELDVSWDVDRLLASAEWCGLNGPTYVKDEVKPLCSENRSVPNVAMYIYIYI